MMLSFHLQFLSCWPYFQMICTPDVSEPFRLSFVHWFLPVDWLCKTYSYWIVNMYYASVLAQLAANSWYWMLSIEINVMVYLTVFWFPEAENWKNVNCLKYLFCIQHIFIKATVTVAETNLKEKKTQFLYKNTIQRRRRRKRRLQWQLLWRNSIICT